MPPLILRILSSSVVIARRAGEVIRDVLRGGDLGVVEKGVNDPQTEADRRAQRCIVSSLKYQYPQVTVVAEEELEPSPADDKDRVDGFEEEVLRAQCPETLTNVKETDITVWVDPLDGTAEFTAGYLDHVTVLIGIAVGSQPIAGVVYQPFYKSESDLGRTLWGMVGLGVHGDFHPTTPTKRRTIASTRSHNTKIATAAVEAMQPDVVLAVGGSGYKCLLVLEGHASAYVFAHPGTKKWDTCAPNALLHAVGGHMCDVKGNLFEYHCGIAHINHLGVLATMADVDWYVGKIPPEVSEILSKNMPNE
ncbi:3'(2'),5'-bisphosphate nucleotidase 1-like isoform X2 [Corticium candelabrum]|uniref:3'(2'),5'-bisphosphate nucleotidase 1-like isoform X2 n=1 Tax=Corticium candelabrum TaxID=121492 RepID=UPI002E266391|nr:3'(2'),5'-bisphosphate nucleotidase 1-like isoform X2 [Corticium candelabrum]